MIAPPPGGAGLAGERGDRHAEGDAGARTSGAGGAGARTASGRSARLLRALGRVGEDPLARRRGHVASVMGRWSSSANPSALHGLSAGAPARWQTTTMIGSHRVSCLQPLHPPRAHASVRGRREGRQHHAWSSAVPERPSLQRARTLASDDCDNPGVIGNRVPVGTSSGRRLRARPEPPASASHRADPAWASVRRGWRAPRSGQGGRRRHRPTSGAGSPRCAAPRRPRPASSRAASRLAAPRPSTTTACFGAS